MAFDPLVANAGRLKILAALAVEGRQEFVRLRGATQLTDGNLASHARRLRAGGLVDIDKQFRDGKPVTHLALTPDGRKALESHVRKLVAALSHRRLGPAPENRIEPEPSAPPTLSIVPGNLDDPSEDEWVD